MNGFDKISNYTKFMPKFPTLEDLVPVPKLLRKNNPTTGLSKNALH